MKPINENGSRLHWVLRERLGSVLPVAAASILTNYLNKKRAMTIVSPRGSQNRWVKDKPL